jgi:uncharacterized protein (TIRG00374 family)
LRRYLRVVDSPLIRVALMISLLGLVVGLLWWRGPDWGEVADAFTAVRWEWVAAAVGFNLLSVVVRAAAWETVIRSAVPPPFPRSSLVFSAFCVGLLANAVLPGRVGELARVAVLSRRLPTVPWPTLVGTVFAHRVFDLVPVFGLVIWVLVTAEIPGWAYTSLWVVLLLGVALFLFALATARHHHRTRLDGLGAVRRIVMMARFGLGVMRRPGSAALAIGFQIAGWTFQVFAVWATMQAFEIHEPLHAAGLVLLMMNVATIVPIWPGNVGLMQVAVATPLRQYGVPYTTGLAFGFGLQAIEASVGIGIGLLFLAKEGLSFANLRQMPGAAEAEVPEAGPEPLEPRPQDRARARVPG